MTELQVRKIGKVYEVALDERPIRVGRSSSNDIVLRSERVSREHCVIELIDGAPRLRDLDSKYGTLINGKKVSEVPIRPGDRIGVGGYEIAFDGLLPPAPAAPEERASAEAASTEIADRLAEELAVRERELEEREQVLEGGEKALEERTQTLDDARIALDEDRAAFDETRPALEDARIALDKDRAAIDAQRAAFDEERAAHERAREDLAAREADLERRESALSAEREAMTTEHRALTERDAEREREMEQMTRRTAEADTDAESEKTRAETEKTRAETEKTRAETEKTRAEKLTLEITAIQSALESSHRETRSVAERLAETEADNESVRKQAAHLSRQLERKSKDLTKTIDRAAALETAHAQAEAARQVLSAQAGKAEALEAAGRAVVAASDYLALVRQSVVGIESQWIETDEIVNESQERGQIDTFQAMQREELSRQLEYAHEERDNAMSDLQEAVTLLSEAITFGRGSTASRRRNLLSR